MDSFNEVVSYISEKTPEKHDCDTNFVYEKTSFNKNLIFDLVKETMNECLDNYSNTLLLSDDYPIHIVQNRILNKIDSIYKVEENSSFLSKDIKAVRERFCLEDPSNLKNDPTEKLVFDIVAEEIKKEGKEWQNVEQEEDELKDAVAHEIMNDLLFNSAYVMNAILKNKVIHNVEVMKDFV